MPSNGSAAIARVRYESSSEASSSGPTAFAAGCPDTVSVSAQNARKKQSAAPKISRGFNAVNFAGTSSRVPLMSDMDISPDQLPTTEFLDPQNVSLRPDETQYDHTDIFKYRQTSRRASDVTSISTSIGGKRPHSPGYDSASENDASSSSNRNSIRKNSINTSSSIISPRRTSRSASNSGQMRTLRLTSVDYGFGVSPISKSPLSPFGSNVRRGSLPAISQTSKNNHGEVVAQTPGTEDAVALLKQFSFPTNGSNLYLRNLTDDIVMEEGPLDPVVGTRDKPSRKLSASVSQPQLRSRPALVESLSSSSIPKFHPGLGFELSASAVNSPALATPALAALTHSPAGSLTSRRSSRFQRDRSSSYISITHPHNVFNLSINVPRKSSLAFTDYSPRLSISISTPGEEPEDTFAKMIRMQDPNYKAERERWTFKAVEHQNVRVKNLTTSRRGKAFQLVPLNEIIPSVVLASPAFHAHASARRMSALSDSEATTKDSEDSKLSIKNRIKKSLFPFVGFGKEEHKNYEPPWLLMSSPSIRSEHQTTHSAHNSALKVVSPRIDRAQSEEPTNSMSDHHDEEEPNVQGWWSGVPADALCMLIPRTYTPGDQDVNMSSSLLVYYCALPPVNSPPQESDDFHKRVHKKGKSDNYRSSASLINPKSLDSFKVIGRWVNSENDGKPSWPAWQTSTDKNPANEGFSARHLGMPVIIALKEGPRRTLEFIPEGLESLGLGTALGGKGEDMERRDRGYLTSDGASVVSFVFTGTQAFLGAHLED